MPTSVAYFEERLASEFVYQDATRREHDVINIELLKTVLQVVFARLGEPRVAKRDRQCTHSVDFCKDVKLERTVFSAADRDNTVVVVVHCLVAIQDGTKFSFAIDPVDANFVLGGLARLADAHFIELDALVGLRHATTRAIAHVSEQRFAVLFV